MQNGKYYSNCYIENNSGYVSTQIRVLKYHLYIDKISVDGNAGMSTLYSNKQYWMRIIIPTDLPPWIAWIEDHCLGPIERQLKHGL